MSFHSPEAYRIGGSRAIHGHSGAFMVPNVAGIGNDPLGACPKCGFVLPQKQPDLRVIASDGGGWEHVSVSTEFRIPTWDEMCFIKSLFWDPEDCVVQFHPPASQYVNCHPYVLHLWREVGRNWPTPPMWMIGPKR